MALRSRFQLTVLVLGAVGFACSPQTASMTLSERGFVLDEDTPVRAFEVRLCMDVAVFDHANANARVVATVDGGGTLEIDILDLSPDSEPPVGLEFSAVATEPGDVSVGLDARGPWEELSGIRCGAPMTVQFALPEDADPDTTVTVAQWAATFEVSVYNRSECGLGEILADDELEIEVSPL